MKGGVGGVEKEMENGSEGNINEFETSSNEMTRKETKESEKKRVN